MTYIYIYIEKHVNMYIYILYSNTIDNIDNIPIPNPRTNGSPGSVAATVAASRPWWRWSVARWTPPRTRWIEVFLGRTFWAERFWFLGDLNRMIYIYRYRCIETYRNIYDYLGHVDNLGTYNTFIWEYFFTIRILQHVKHALFLCGFVVWIHFWIVTRMTVTTSCHHVVWREWIVMGIEIPK